MDRSLIQSPSAGFETPLEMLEACHQRLEAQLIRLARLAQWLPLHGADIEAQCAATRILHYFDSAAPKHHIDEEDDLCPLLLRRVADEERGALQSLVAWISEDHQRLLAGWAQLRGRLEAISHGRMTELPPAEVGAFIAGYRRHIEREESELLPCARKLLTESDRAALTRTMTARRRYRFKG